MYSHLVNIFQFYKSHKDIKTIGKMSFVYALFEVYFDGDGYKCFKLLSVCDSLIRCQECVPKDKEETEEQQIDDFHVKFYNYVVESTRKTLLKDYVYDGSRVNKSYDVGYLIEKIELNK